MGPVTKFSGGDRLPHLTSSTLKLSKRKSGLRADYSKKCEDLYTEVALILLKEEGLEILSYCQLPDTAEQLKIPSWGPDWSREVHSPL
jgi:hypothetical protein